MSIPGGSNLLLLTSAAGGGGGGYEISRSLRFNSSDSAYLSRTPASGGNRKTWTFSFWYKKTKNGQTGYESILGISTGGSTYFTMRFGQGGAADCFTVEDSSGYTGYTSSVFRDPSAWYHFVVAVDTTKATASDRVKVYVNGVSQTLSSQPSQNVDFLLNTTNRTDIGNLGATYSTYYINGYLAECYLIDGQQLTPTSLGEFDTNGVWQPIEYTGTFGTNGFHLPFSDNSTAAALGTDTSGNGNTWTVNNLSVTGAINIGYPQALTAGSGSVTNPSLAFDGSTGTEAVANTSATITFTPPTPISFSTKLEFWTSNGNGPGSNDQRYSFNGGSEVTCSGGEWTTVVTGSGTLTSLAIRNAFVGATISRLNAVRVDNNILLYNSGAGNDSLVDTPTNGSQEDTGVGGEVVGNYATLNPLSNGAGTLSNGNLQLGGIGGAGTGRCNSTIAVSNGKWYFESTLTTAAAYTNVGIGQGDITNQYPGQDSVSYAFTCEQAIKISNNSQPSYGVSLTTGDILMVAFDLDNSKIFFGKNGTWMASSDPATGANPAFTLAAGTYKPIARPYGSTGVINVNFGQRPFAYTAPSGFKALCTTNLPEPTIADGSTAMDVALWTGDGGSTKTISGLGFSPDFIWTKQRNQTYYHQIYDAVRGLGVGKALASNADTVEGYGDSAQYGYISSATADGFIGTAGTGTPLYVNQTSTTYVAWCWDAGSSTVTNTAGSISSQVRANASAGFSVVTWTGTGSGSATIGHGLGVKPRFILVKKRNATGPWYTQHGSLGAGQIAYLNATDAFGATSGWNSTEPTSTVFSLGSAINDANTYVAYCFAPVAGYSSFGSYTGNGSATAGPFVYTGFRPRWILIKRSDASNDWLLTDSARLGYNTRNELIWANGSSAEIQIEHLDILSNGFKIRTTNPGWNASGGTYIYCAFAESPFQYARAR